MSTFTPPDHSTDVTMTVDALVRAIGVNTSDPKMLFLGAGASVSSGLPTATQCVWEWKKEIYVSNNPTLGEHVRELSLISVRDRIQSWLDAQKTYPTSGSKEEYAIYIERCFPLPESRKAYFTKKILQANPHIGYRLLGIVAEAGIFNTVWTTNFDCLVTRAAANCKIIPIEVGIDCQERLPRKPRDGELMAVYLHGDYRYDHIKNTTIETQEQEQQLLTAFSNECQERDLVVCGYSGNDLELYKQLCENYARPGSGALFWCGIEEEVPPHIHSLLVAARAAGRNAYFVAISSFDDLLIRIAHHSLSAEHREKALKVMEDLAPAGDTRSTFSLTIPAVSKLLKSNFFPIELPSEVYSFKVKKMPEKGVWKWVSSTARSKGVTAVPYKGSVLAIGTLTSIKEAFGDNIMGSVDRTPLTEHDLRYPDGVIVSLLQASLLFATAAKYGLSTDDKHLLWNPKDPQTHTLKGKKFRVHEAATVSLRYLRGQSFLAILPTCYLLAEDSSKLDPDVNKVVKAQLLSGQYNEQYNAALDSWRRILLPDSTNTIECPPDNGSFFKFMIKRNPEFVGIGSSSRHTVAIDKLRIPITRKGIVVEEPHLLFADATGKTRALDKHPIRGLLQNKPFDFALTRSGLSDTIRVAVICPKTDSAVFSTFLQRGLKALSPRDKERDYLPDYPGFQLAFSLNLQMPTKEDSGWHHLQEPLLAGSEEKVAVQLATAINRAIDQVAASSNSNVVVVCVPDRWEPFKRFDNPTERFDLHDFVKAYCVTKGIATQFIEHSTIADAQQCRVWWWLSLALYAKAMRTPWVLNGLDPDSAFVGIGYSIDNHSSRYKQIVLGCSHIYNSDGQGLQFRLSKIHNPIIRNRNPYLDVDDARRLGETIRQLFFDARHVLPKRVVIHKRTPFIKSEREGLYQGLEGIPDLEFVELNEDPPFRLINSFTTSLGQSEIDKFPVERGTLTIIDDFSALLWIHGSAQALNPNWRYYQGKRRIPAPVLIKRHSGHGDLKQIAVEMLGLSKMNWNSFDLYSKMPATVHSSSHIARIGSLLERFGHTAYDYRLFI